MPDGAPAVLGKVQYCYSSTRLYRFGDCAIPRLGVVAAGLLLVLADLSGLWEWVARGAALVWIVYYTVLDSIQDIFLGWIIAKSLNAGP